MIDKLFIDSNSILDLIQERENYADATLLFTLVEENKVRAFVSPLIFANLFYILRKQESSTFALRVLIRLKALVHILTIRNGTVWFLFAYTVFLRHVRDYVEWSLSIVALKKYHFS